MGEPAASPSSGAEQEPSTPSDPSGWSHALFPLLLALLFSVAALLLVSRFRGRADTFQAYGYFGVFLVSFLGNATIVLPAPSLVFTTAVGAILNPFAVGLVAGAGEALGEMTGYLGGISGKRIIEGRAHYDTIQTYMNRYGGWMYLVLSIIPNPLFDIAGLTAGAMRYPVWKFLLIVWLGKTIKSLMFAHAGFQILR
jgi:membrane protein YqaA with SNARE-associated domain